MIHFLSLCIILMYHFDTCALFCSMRILRSMCVVEFHVYCLYELRGSDKKVGCRPPGGNVGDSRLTPRRRDR